MHKYSNTLIRSVSWAILVCLCRMLHQLMHESSPAALVIWYDAITTEGKLRWQDSLTDLNQPFFSACDLLFVNYTWSAETPLACAEKAGQLALHSMPLRKCMKKDINSYIVIFCRQAAGLRKSTWALMSLGETHLVVGASIAILP